jgi:hypothetical protein
VRRTCHRAAQTGRRNARAAADQLYADTALKLCNGLEALLKTYETAADPARKKIYRVWREASH